MRFRKYVGLICLLNLQSCTLIDDYILGKDNTRKPSVLTDIKARVTLTQQWSTSIGKATSAHTYLKLKPVRSEQAIYSADPSGRISAVQDQTGRVLWTQQLHNDVVSGPTLAQGVLILGTDAATLVALSQRDGHQLWEAHLSEDALSKSAVSGQTVIAKSIDGHLYAFDLMTGKQLWMVEHGSPNLILRASSSPKVMGGLVLVGYSDGKLDAVEISTGRVVWQRSIVYASGASDIERLVDIDADPIIRGNVVYLASYQSYVGALNLDNGQFIWSKEASVYKNIALDQNTLYASDSHDTVWAYNKSTGQIRWKQTALKGHGVTEPVLIGNRIVVGDKTGYLHVLSKENGALIGRKQLGSSIVISPAVSGDRCIVFTSNGVMQSFKLEALS